jgi:hypothetical protein
MAEMTETGSTDEKNEKTKIWKFSGQRTDYDLRPGGLNEIHGRTSIRIPSLRVKILNTSTLTRSAGLTYSSYRSGSSVFKILGT